MTMEEDMQIVQMSITDANKLVEEEISLIANYFRKMGKKQIAMAIENGDYKNEE